MQVYGRAIAGVAETCRAAKFSPLHPGPGGGTVLDGEAGLRSCSQRLRPPGWRLIFQFLKIAVAAVICY